MKKLPFIILLVALSIGSTAFCQNSMEKFPGSESKEKSFFFDSIIPVWVAPTSGYYEETCEKVWDSCEKKYVYVTQERWVEGSQGHYSNISKLFLNKNGLVVLATEEVLEKEMVKEINTSKSYRKYKNKNELATLGAIGFTLGMGMVLLPSCAENPEVFDFVTPGYVMTSVGLMVVGGIIALSASKSSEYEKNKAIKKYNSKNISSTKSWSLHPNVRLKEGRVNSSFILKLKF